MRQPGEGSTTSTRALECALAAAAALLAADVLRTTLWPLYRVLGLLLGN